MTKAQSIVLEAIAACIVRSGDSYVSQGPISSYMPSGKLPHPNTLDAMVRSGVIERDPNANHAAYRIV